MSARQAPKGKGRPKDEREKVRVRITLDLVVGEDDDLIALYRAAGPRGKARATKIAMRAGGVSVAFEQFQDDEEEMEHDLAGFLF